MKIILHILFVVIIVGVCQKDSFAHNYDKIVCETNKPLEELPWLRERVDGMKNNQSNAAIYCCDYGNQQGFLSDDCVNCPDGMSEFYDCQGNILCEFGGIAGLNTCPDFEANLTDKVLIFEIK